MRILHVADLHFRLGWYEWLSNQTHNYDVLVIAGDLLNNLSCEDTPLPQQARIVGDWLRKAPKLTVVCSGNHDVWPHGEGGGAEAWADGGWLKLCQRDGVVVDGQTVRHGGEQISSVKWTHADWPAGSSIVVVHAPPAWTRISVDASGVDFGDIKVAERIAKTHPAFVLSGHVHSASDWLEVCGTSVCLNPGCDWMALVPNHIYIDTTERTARWFTARKGYVERRLDDCAPRLLAR